MANTYTLISSVTVGAGGAASIDFTSIPSTYTDLAVLVSGRTATASGTPYQGFTIKFNTDTTAANYPSRYLLGNGSTASSGNDSANRYFMWATNGSATTSTFGNSLAYIPNYAGSNYKSYSVDGVTENNATAALTTLLAGVWQSTSAINAISLAPAGDTFVQYSTAYLYGIRSS